MAYRGFPDQAGEFSDRDGVLPDGRVRRGRSVISADDASRTRMDRDRNQALSRETGANPENQVGYRGTGAGPTMETPPAPRQFSSAPDMDRPVSFSNGGGQDAESQGRAREAFAAFRQSAADNRGPVDVRSYVGSRYDPNFAGNNPQLQPAVQESDAVKIARIGAQARTAPAIPAVPASSAGTQAPSAAIPMVAGSTPTAPRQNAAMANQIEGQAPAASVNDSRLAAATSAPPAPIPARAAAPAPAASPFELTYRKADGSFYGETRDGRSQAFPTQAEATAFSRGPVPVATPSPAVAPAPAAPAPFERPLSSFTPAQQQVMQQPVGSAAGRAFLPPDQQSPIMPAPQVMPFNAQGNPIMPAPQVMAYDAPGNPISAAPMVAPVSAQPAAPAPVSQPAIPANMEPDPAKPGAYRYKGGFASMVDRLKPTPVAPFSADKGGAYVPRAVPAATPTNSPRAIQRTPILPPSPSSLSPNRDAGGIQMPAPSTEPLDFPILSSVGSRRPRARLA